MRRTLSELTCSRCERPLPTDRADVELWKNSELVLTGELDDLTTAMLLCPECDAELRDVTYDEAAGG